MTRNRRFGRLSVTIGLIAATAGAAQPRSATAEAHAAMPTLPERVVAAPFYNGRLEAIYVFFSRPFEELVRTLHPEVERGRELYRHRSLPLGWRSGEEEGLIHDLRRSAEAAGWDEVPELHLDGSGLYQALGFRRRGEVLYVLALGDPFAADGDNPGVSLEFLDEQAQGCSPDDCTGFVPVFVWSTVSDRDPRRSGPPPWVSPDAPRSFAPDWRWTDDTTWNEVEEAALQ